MNERQDGIPGRDAHDPATLAEAAQQARDFRARENPPLTEDEGLPSVNRRKENNKLVTFLGMFFIVAAGAAMIVAVNNDRNKTPKNQDKEKVANNLPPIVMPPPPAPVTIAAMGPQGGVQVVKEAAPEAQQPEPQPVASKTGPNGKPPLDWTDRKMMGTVVVGARAGETGAQGEPPQPHDSGSKRNDGDPSFADKGELAVKLEPTVTKAAEASVLPNRNFIIAKGSTLDCALETAINTTQPGLTRCRLTSDVYSDDGKVVLLDRGSQLVGEYQGGIKRGQARVFVLWTRAKTPNGVVINLNSPGTDALGRGGLEGWVDNHFIERFGAAIMVTLLQDAVAFLIAQQQAQHQGGTVLFGQNTVQGGEKFIEKTLDAQINIPPTLYKNQGDHIQVMVARDLDFSDIYGLEVAR